MSKGAKHKKNPKFDLSSIIRNKSAFVQNYFADIKRATR